MMPFAVASLPLRSSRRRTRRRRARWFVRNEYFVSQVFTSICDGSFSGLPDRAAVFLSQLTQSGSRPKQLLMVALVIAAAAGGKDLTRVATDDVDISTSASE